MLIFKSSLLAYVTPLCRRMSFKVLNSELRLNGQEISEARQQAKNVSQVLKTLSDFVKGGGGKKAIHRHTVINKKLLVRDRLKLLCDADSEFFEIGLLAGMFMEYGNLPGAAAVTGIGKIHGHYCLISAHDATVKGGTFFPISVTKFYRFQQLAYLNKLPCIYIVDSGGAFLPLQAEIFPDRNHGGRTFYNEAVLSSMGIPQIAVVCGSSTAGGAYAPTMAEEALIMKGPGLIFLGGPPLVKAATGEIVTEQELGGAMMHCSVSGCTDYYAETEEEVFEMCRESVLTLNFPEIPTQKPFSNPKYPAEDLLLLSVKEKLNKEDMYVILSRILDESEFKEFKQKFGTNLITGFGFIHGKLIGLLANCGSLSYQDAQKGCHFIQLCENRRIPLCFLQNSSYLEDFDHLCAFDSIKDRAKMTKAHSSSTVPKITICIKSCFEDDNFIMCGWGFEPNFFFMWPLAHVSGILESVEKVKSSLQLLDKLKETTDMNEFENLFDEKTSAFYQASRMTCDAVIHPDKTREVLAFCLRVFSHQLTPKC